MFNSIIYYLSVYLDQAGFEKDFRVRHDGEVDGQQEVGRESDENIAEDDPARCQFHQRSTYSFYACRSQKRKKILMTELYSITLLGSTSVKVVRKTLMKLRASVDFINVLLFSTY